MSSRSSSSSSGPADRDVSFSGQAVSSAGSKFQPFSYHPRPLGPRDVEVKIQYCGVCASDVHTVSGGWGECMYPCIPGHEIVGEVAQVGPEVRAHKPGDRVGVGPQVLACMNKSGDCKSCSQGLSNVCPSAVLTYNSKYPDGAQSQGGYASRIRVREDFVLALPASLPSAAAAPLLCAGVTTFAPLRRCKVGQGTRVAVIGIGGLGHVALKFAKAMGAEVTAVSSSKKKEADAKGLGADKHVDFNNEQEFEAVKGKMDVVLCTANAKGMDYNKYFDLVAPGGTFILVGLPEEDITIKPAKLVMKQATLHASLVGSMEEQKEMIAFAAEHGITAQVEVMDMKQANEAFEKMKNGDVRYRIVLKNNDQE